MSTSYSGKHTMKVREHKILGPYVEGLSKLAVSSFEVRQRDVSVFIRLFSITAGQVILSFVERLSQC